MGTHVTVAKLPPCDMCADGTLALFDGKTVFGPWAYMCAPHWSQVGPGRLGTGIGQELVLATNPTTPEGTDHA